MKPIGYLFSLFLALMFIGCDSLFCDTENKLAPEDGYIVVGEYKALGSRFYRNGGDNHIIRSEQEFEDILGAYSKPYIDWTIHSLVGTQRLDTKCGSELFSSIAINHSKKNYHIKLYACDDCWSNYESAIHAWFLVPKAPAGYTVTSELN